MRLRPLAIAGAYVIELEPVIDARGSFARTFDAAFMRQHGLVEQFAVEAIATNERAGTIRGMHFQRSPYGETKIVRALSGTVFDVIVDVRTDTATFGTSITFELTARAGMAIYIPPGCAHGYQTLSNDAVVWYAIAGDYRPEFAGGLRYDDPDCAISWPLAVSTVSPDDLRLPLLAALR